MAKVIQIAATETQVPDEDCVGSLYALCEDGSLWLMADPWRKDTTWKKLPEPAED